MKKLSVILALAVTLVGSTAHAQTYGNNSNSYNRKDSKNNNANANNDFQWGVGLMGLAVLGVVVGLTAASASSSPNNYSSSK